MISQVKYINLILFDYIQSIWYFPSAGNVEETENLAVIYIYIYIYIYIEFWLKPKENGKASHGLWTYVQHVQATEWAPSSHTSHLLLISVASWMWQTIMKYMLA